MTQEEIIEGNKLIAEFMGGIYQKDDYDTFGYAFPSNVANIRGRYFTIDGLQYHSSYDWLMMVVEKIEDISDFNIKIDSSYITISKYNNIVMLFKKTSKIEMVYLAVVEFIKWYNSQLK